MKRILSFILFVAMLLTLYACNSTANTPEDTSSMQTTAEATTEATEPKTTPPKSLKILAIGNSFSVDTTWHLYTVAKLEGVKEIVIGNMYVGSCNLAMHLDYAKNNEAKYVYYKNNNNSWVQTENTTLEYALQDEEWDFITFQQGGKDSGIPDSYNLYLDELVTYVRETAVKKDFKLFWNMTWAYQSNCSLESFIERYDKDQFKMYDCIVDATLMNIVDNEAFDGILPVATVIQNARTSYLGDNFTRDGYHLNEFARLLAAYTWYCSFTDQTLTDVKFTSIGSQALTKEQKSIIIQAVNGALNSPLEITKVS